MIQQQPNVRMSLVNRPENVVLVRDVLSGLGEALDLGGTVEDIKAAVSEAANNVVIHAYGGGEGPMEVEIALGGRYLDVVVRDHGVGIGPRAVDDANPGRGIGLAVIDALAAGCELRANDAAGVEVAMRFDVPPQPELRGMPADDPGAAVWHGADDHQLEIVIAPASLSARVFERVVTGLAARAGFSIDRLSDVQLLADALTARIGPALQSDHLRLGFVARDRGMELRIAPLRAGGGMSLLGDSVLAELGPVIERLADEVRTGEDADGEVLAVVMRDRRPSVPPAIG